MKPLIFNADHIIPPETIKDLPQSYEIHFNRFGNNQGIDGPVSFFSDALNKIFVDINEPPYPICSMTEKAETVIANQSHYTSIITSNTSILNSCTNSIKMSYGTTWLNKSKNNHKDAIGTFTDSLGELKKENTLSMVCTSHTKHKPYEIRHTTWNNKQKIPAELKFYSSTRYPVQFNNLLPNDDKINLFYSMYSVAIENSSIPNYFTEKLIDCLITKTIPIYWGCPNIDEYFDTSYWINVKDIFTFNYTEEYYYNNLHKINNNFEKAKEYCKPMLDRIILAISKETK
jgi:hypothetical protein